MEPRIIGAGTAMDDPNADLYLISGVKGREPNSSWRWTEPRAEFRLHPTETKNQFLVVRYSVAGVTFQSTGPVTFSIAVEGKEVFHPRVTEFGIGVWRIPVSENLLRTDRPVAVVMEVDKFYTTPEDGARLGFQVQSIGFEP